jgi:hypothetical protein
VKSRKIEGQDGDDYLNSIFKQEVKPHMNQADFDNFLFGICATEKEDGSYLGEIETIRLLKGN